MSIFSFLLNALWIVCGGLWMKQGKRPEALEILGFTYGRFTEGFDTRDLKNADTLLAELRS